MKYAAITAQRDSFPVQMMCRVLGVARAGYYAAQQRAARGPTPRGVAELGVRLAIRAAHRASHRRYGAPRIHHELHQQGFHVSRKRVAALMRHEGLVGKRPRPFCVTTRPATRLPAVTNTLARRFAVAAIGGRNRVWASDLTFVPTREGWLYLAVVLDLGSRRVIGHALATTMSQHLVLTALTRALAHRRPPPGVVHHSDRGTQYASGLYQQVLTRHHMRCSMSQPANCWDNAVVESFFATLKTELARDTYWPTRLDAVAAITEYVRWYNTSRRHSSLGYRSPVQFEHALPRGTHAA